MSADFQLTQRAPIARLNAELQDYIHPTTGMRHVHVASADPEMAFLIGFPSLPSRSDGCPHILEHLVLTGSRRYPVRDPFFSMMRRSMATFMNALTYADRTVYPFSTVDKKDFGNLMDVYLDAVFFPRLEYADFLQEGWRLEAGEEGLRYQGVVLNEMKGAMSDPLRHVYLAIQRELFSGTTYAVNSGGDPRDIPSLTHDTLRQFHAEHYHPSQAVVMTWGAVDVCAVQQQLANQVLAHFSGERPRRLPGLAATPAAPITATVRVPGSRDDSSHEFGLQRAWVLGPTASAQARIHGRLLEAILLGHPGAPLSAAMATWGQGRASPISMADDETQHVVLNAGIVGLPEHTLADAQNLIEDTLRRTVREGTDPQAVSSAMREIRYQLRRDTKGVHRLIDWVKYALRGADMREVLSADVQADRLASALEKPGHLQGLLQDMLDSPHQLILRVEPQPDYVAAQADDEFARLHTLAHSLTEAERAALPRPSPSSEEVTSTGAQPSPLPQLRLHEVTDPQREVASFDANGLTVVPVAANGLSHAIVKIDVSDLATADELGWMAIYAGLLPQLGARGMHFAEATSWRQARVADFQSSLQALDLQNGTAGLEFTLSCTCLQETQEEMFEVITSWLESPNLEEQDRLQYLITTLANEAMQQLAHQPDTFAQLLASSALSARDQLEHQLEGLPGLTFKASWAARLDAPDGLPTAVAALQRARDQLAAAPRRVICAVDASDQANVLERSKAVRPSGAPITPAARPQRAVTACALHVPAPVNACCVGWAVPTLGHADAAALHVAASLLDQQFLHTALRERGGAYVVNTFFDWQSGVFSIRTARDPRLAETFRDIRQVLKNLDNHIVSAEALEEAILSTLKNMDMPMFPVQSLLFSWRLQRSGIDSARWASHRAAVARCTLGEIQQAVRRWLVWDHASRAAVAGHLGQDLDGLAVTDPMAELAAATSADITSH